MPKSILQNYYCIVSKTKFGKPSLIIKQGTRRDHVEIEVRKEGYRVLVALTKEQLMKLQQTPPEQFFKVKKSWSTESYNFIKNIKL